MDLDSIQCVPQIQVYVLKTPVLYIPLPFSEYLNIKMNFVNTNKTYEYFNFKRNI